MDTQETTRLDIPPSYHDIINAEFPNLYDNKAYDAYRGRIKKYEELLKRQDVLEKDSGQLHFHIVCLYVFFVIFLIFTIISIIYACTCPEDK